MKAKKDMKYVLNAVVLVIVLEALAPFCFAGVENVFIENRWC